VDVEREAPSNFIGETDPIGWRRGPDSYRPFAPLVVGVG